MKKVIESGTYCSQCNIFLSHEKRMDWECWCAAEDWHEADMIIETKKSIMERIKDGEFE
ncbi:hypothetical protein [Virgibacillus halodenitrificans]|uniref:Cysteine-rich CPCC domain-containing protein n=1 Tax=Virgibacillus halodenitrificans TaxID=1482 RepID=A0ABR7VM16_VIRHA|nr:hypothetical protein [Virgibacillus halodenitrificans]MBD1222776.1 hypothetical protein [Virgibacillus halodenitrificans]